MRKNLLKGFLGSAAALALTLSDVSAANPQEGGNAFANGFYAGLGYGLDLTVMTNKGEEESGIDMEKDALFGGKNAKWKGDATNGYSNLKSQSGALTAESYENPDVKNYQQEIAKAKGDEDITTGFLGDSHSLGYAHKELGDNGDKRAMSHYGWLQAGYAFGFGDWVVEPALTLKVKGSSSSRKIEDESTIYSPYLGGSLGTEFVEVTGDNASKVKKFITDSTDQTGKAGGVLVKIGTYETEAVAAELTNVGAGASANLKIAKEEYANINTANIASMKFNGQKIDGAAANASNAEKIQEFLNEKVFKLGKGASGSYLHQTVYAKRDISFELKNNFEAALHANVGYALNEYVMPYVKLGLSMDVYKVEVKKGAISFDADDALYNPLAFKYDPAAAKDNLYFKTKDDISITNGQKVSDKQVASSDMYLLVNPEDRSGYKEVKDNKQLVTDQAKLEEMKAGAGLSVESVNDKASKEKNTFVQLNAEFGVGVAANVYKGLQLRAEFVYALPMNKEKKMYDDTVELNMAPHKLKFNFGVVVPLNMMMGK